MEPATENVKASMSKHVQNTYDKKLPTLQSKLPWYKNSSGDIPLPPLSPDKPTSSEQPSMEFLQGRSTQHTKKIGLFPEYDEPHLQAKVTKPLHSPSGTSTPTNSPGKNIKATSPDKMKWRGRMSWEHDLLEPDSSKSPTKRHPSPLKSVHGLHSILPKELLEECQGKSNRNELKPNEKEDEIDALLAKFKVTMEARSGIRDTLLAKGMKDLHSYSFTSPEPTPVELAILDEETRLNRVQSPTGPERRMKNPKKSLENDGNSSSEEEGGDEEVDMAQRMKDSYFGVQARATFFDKYANLHGKPHCFMAVPSKTNDPTQFQYQSASKVVRKDTTHHTSDNEIKMSPRTLFLSSCVAETEQLPMALPILIRKHGTTAFDFSYQSLGDAFLIEFARALRDVPYVEEINVCDNRLSDRALNHLLLALETKPNLTKLDISMNQVGSRSAKTLKSYIGSPMCTLTHLSVCKADIDDSECAAFMVAFESNKSVVDLRMSRNRIGEAENLNVVQPDFTTGGEAIGGMLNVNLTLTQLDVSWNLLRLASGVTLANSLKLNYNLFELNLSYNALGDAGAMAFGQSLVVNKTLRHLDISYNNIGTKGASVLASTVARSRTLGVLVLDGNNIGQQGGKVLMYAMVNNRTPNGCAVSMRACNLNERIKSKIFDPLEPGGEYLLDCADPYDNMVATELLRLATFKKGCSYARLEYKPTRDAPKKLSQPIQLSRRTATRGNPSSSAPKTLLDLRFHDIDTKNAGSITVKDLHGVLHELGFKTSLEQTEQLFEKIDTDNSGTIDEAELSGDLFHAVFQVIDGNQSGAIDIQELRNAFNLLGSQATEQDVQAAMSSYDVDGSGTIEEEEFVELMRNQVIQRAHQHQATHAPDTMAFHEESNGTIWTIPTTGYLDILFIYERELMNERESLYCYGLSDHGLKRLVQTVEKGKETMQHQDLLNAAVEDTEIKMTAAQAWTLMESCGELHETKRVQAVARLLPQLTAIKESHALVKRVLTLPERYSLRVRLGALYFPLMGLPTNHYFIDLTRPLDRQALIKLAEFAQAEKQFSKSRSGRGDTSQHGNWENFRNEILDNKPMILTSAFFQALPTKGKLEFDYVSTTRPSRGTKPMSERRYQQLLSLIGRDSRVELKLSVSTPRRQNVGERWELVRMAVRFRKFKKWIDGVKLAFHVDSRSKESITNKLFQIETAVCDRWLSVKQALQIVQCMPSDFNGKTETCRLLFPRIIDIDNFMEIFDLLSRQEQAECARILGWLNVLNPFHPDRYYEFDLSVREEREAVKIFVMLAVTEPGENWINESFGWIRGEPPIPGWELPKSWANDDVTAEDGPRRSGFLTFEYTSDPARGCSAVPSVRQELQLRVLCGTRLYL